MLARHEHRDKNFITAVRDLANFMYNGRENLVISREKVMSDGDVVRRFATNIANDDAVREHLGLLWSPQTKGRSVAVVCD